MWEGMMSQVTRANCALWLNYEMGIWEHLYMEHVFQVYSDGASWRNYYNTNDWIE